MDEGEKDPIDSWYSSDPRLSLALFAGKAGMSRISFFMSVERKMFSLSLPTFFSLSLDSTLGTTQGNEALIPFFSPQDSIPH